VIRHAGTFVRAVPIGSFVRATDGAACKRVSVVTGWLCSSAGVYCGKGLWLCGGLCSYA